MTGAWPAAVAVSVLATLVGAGTASLFPDGLAPVDVGVPAAARATLSAKSCAGCHADAHADWAGSRHAHAWTNPIFQREYRDRPLAWCVHCHAPLREQIDEIRRGGGALSDEGVTCVACHVRGGHMLARAHSPRSPHLTDARPDFGGPSFCAGCHQFNFPFIEPNGAVTHYTDHPMQETVAQHDRGPYAGDECLSCHGSGAGGHRYPGGHDPTMIQRAMKMDACRDGRTLEVHLTNAAAGHNVPTGDVHRHLVLRAWHPSAPERLQETVLGRRFEPAPDAGKLTVEDTSIPPGTTRAVRVPLDALGPRESDGEPISLELRLVYTIDEFPVPGREVGEPTWATMLTHDLRQGALPRCRHEADRASTPGKRDNAPRAPVAPAAPAALAAPAPPLIK